MHVFTACERSCIYMRVVLYVNTHLYLSLVKVDCVQVSQVLGKVRVSVPRGV